MLLDEFNPFEAPVMSPSDLYSPVEGMPKVLVSCFSHVTFERMIAPLHPVQLAKSKCANGDFPLYRGEYEGTPVALMMAAVGAPSCVGMMEEAFAMGVETAVVFGNCGVLDQRIRDCSIILPTSALRDEGTSYHYAPAAEEIAVNPVYREDFCRMLEEIGCSYTLGKVWTTDAFYRETREKMRRRRAAGCVCVDMECSALAALARFRDKEVFQFFYAGDNLDSEQWDPRSLSRHALLEEKDRVALLALELARRITIKKDKAPGARP